MAVPASRRPRVRVAAVITIEGKLLLVRQSKGGESYFLLPGGGVKRGETLEAALQREVLEETGLHCRLGNPLFINDSIAPDGSRHLVNMTFHATVTGGELLSAPTDPTIEGFELAPIDTLDSLDFRPPVASSIIAAARESYSGPTRYLGSLWTPELP